MDCEKFFASVTSRLDHLSDQSHTSSAHQCAVDFFHPRTAETLGDSSLVSAFYRSGIVWFGPDRTIKVELRIPEAYDDRVMETLDALDEYRVSRTAHRPAAMSSGEYLSLVHYGITCTEATDEDLNAILDAVGDVLSV